MKRKKKASYNAQSFPDFKFGHVFPPNFTPNNVHNSELRECLSAASYLASQIDLAEGPIHIRDENIRSLYFRATLAELIRVEDITKKIGTPLKFDKTDNPLLHTVKLLRNYQVHISSVNIGAGSVLVDYLGERCVYKSYIADNLDSNQLRNLHSSDSYTDEQLTELVCLFNEHQRKYGVVQLLYNTCLYVGQLLEVA